MKFRSTILILFLIAVFCLSIFPQEKTEDVPADFETDKCTFFPDGNYADCCVAHDKDYYKGGTCKERRVSDDRLYRCVKGKKGWKNKVLAPIMWVGVRVMGVSFLPTPFRWGFGRKKEKRKMQVFNLPPENKPETELKTSLPVAAPSPETDKKDSVISDFELKEVKTTEPNPSDNKNEQSF